MVSVTYELRFGDKDGEIVEVADKNSPLTFPYGSGLLLPAFENALSDKNVGDMFEISMTPETGYGEINNQMIVSMPISTFIIDGKIDDDMVKVGNTLPMMANDGNMIPGKVIAIENEQVIMDFNHPLAGKNLFFIGEVIEVRDATEEELNHSCGDDDCCGDESCGGCGK